MNPGLRLDTRIVLSRLANVNKLLSLAVSVLQEMRNPPVKDLCIANSFLCCGTIFILKAGHKRLEFSGLEDIPGVGENLSSARYDEAKVGVW